MMIEYNINRSQRANFNAKEGNPSPIQLNFTIIEPLTPDLTLPALFGQPSMRQDKVTIGKKVLATEEINNFIDVLKNKQKPIRSEEHTSELQSRGHLVCRLLLEKKKKKEY